jgi:alpha-1,3-mannosyltransferase
MKKRLLFIAPDFPPSIGGVERFVESLVKKIPRAEFDVAILAGTRVAKSTRSAVTEIQYTAAVTRIPTFSIKGLDFPRSPFSYFRIWKFLGHTEIVHLNDIRCFFITVVLAKMMYGFKLVVTSHGFIFHTKRFTLLKKLYTWFFLFCLKRLKAMKYFARSTL